MQTIFRVQTPFTCNGRMKTECYVFDFAPDRTLRVLAEAARVSTRAGKQTAGDRKQLGEFLNFCPIISVEGSQMMHYDVERMMGELKRAQIERVVQDGFENGALYNDELLKLTDVDLKDFAALKKQIGSTKAMPKTGDIDVNRQGFTDEEYDEKEKLEKKHKKDLTEEEKNRLEELKKKGDQRRSAISILRGISIRMPLRHGKNSCRGALPSRPSRSSAGIMILTCSARPESESGRWRAPRTGSRLRRGSSASQPFSTPSETLTRKQSLLPGAW